MSIQPEPITASLFADAIKDLPVPDIYAKVSEIQNSIAHLHRSNSEMKEFVAESCDTEEDKREIEGYVSENEGVVKSMTERIALLKAEVERQGQRWIEAPNGTDVNENNNEDAGAGAHGDRTTAAAAAAQPVTNGTPEDEAHRDGTTQESEDRDAEAEQNGIYL